MRFSEKSLFIYGELLEFLEVDFGHASCRINLIYDPADDDTDDLDLSILKLIELTASKLAIRVGVKDEAYARYLGADRLLELSSDRFLVAFCAADVGPEADVPVGSCTSGPPVNGVRAKRDLSESKPNESEENVEAESPYGSRNRCAKKAGKVEEVPFNKAQNLGKDVAANVHGSEEDPNFDEQKFCGTDRPDAKDGRQDKSEAAYGNTGIRKS